MQQEESNKMKPNQKDELEKKTDNEFVRKFAEEKYKYGFTTEVHTDIIERGLNEDVIRLISSKKDEPEWLLEFRLKAYRHWLTLEMPTWAHLRIPEIDYHIGADTLNHYEHDTLFFEKLALNLKRSPSQMAVITTSNKTSTQAKQAGLASIFVAKSPVSHTQILESLPED